MSGAYSALCAALAAASHVPSGHSPQTSLLKDRYAVVVEEALRCSAFPLGKRLGPERPPKPHTFRISENWEPSSRWRLLFQGLWDRREQIAILELRTLGLLARHLSRSKANWNMRHLAFTHSMGAGGAASKGRSGVFGMLLVCRQLLVCQVTWGVKLMLRFVPSFYHNSDHPSRGGPVGVHPDTLLEHKHQERVAAST